MLDFFQTRYKDTLLLEMGAYPLIATDSADPWRWPMAMRACTELAAQNLFWIEEPTHPDDVLGHRRLAEAVAPVKIAAGEHVPNRVVFKNLIQAKAIQVVQVDADKNLLLVRGGVPGHPNSLVRIRAARAPK